MTDTNALAVLLAACANRDRTAFERLYRLTAPRLYGLSLRMMQRRDLAEEVLQEAFLQIWRDAPRFNPDRAAPMTWMGTIVRHRALDVLRARRSAAARVSVSNTTDAGDVADSHPTTDPGPMERLLAGAAANALHRCLERLSVDQRRSILLAFFNGLSHAELSETLAQPVGTVKSWIRRGLTRLRACLET